MKADIEIGNHGSIVILNALSDQAIDWMEEHLDPEVQRWGRNGYVIEPRYVEDIIVGAIEAGLTLEEL